MRSRVLWLVIVVLLGGALSGCSGHASISLPPASAPSDVVLDSYLQALVAGDCAAARAMETEQLAGECNTSDRKRTRLNSRPAEIYTFPTRRSSDLHLTSCSTRTCRLSWRGIARRPGRWRPSSSQVSATHLSVDMRSTIAALSRPLSPQILFSTWFH